MTEPFGPRAPGDLSVVDLVRSYRDLEVLKGLTLHVPQGTVAAVIGANGSGKTTLLRTLAGSLDPTAGPVELIALSEDAFESLVHPEAFQRGRGGVEPCRIDNSQTVRTDNQTLLDKVATLWLSTKSRGCLATELAMMSWRRRASCWIA